MREPSVDDTYDNSLLVDKQGWDDYWNKKNKGGIVYSLIAEFYRKVIIRPNLMRLIKKHFPKGSRLLHAGCGSGQVDSELAGDYRLVGLDISKRALEIFRQTHGNRGEVLQASVFDVRLPNQSVDGIYNLGVMEHFTEDEIQTALNEFHRVLKPNGKFVAFWPPEFGTSVLFFKFLKQLCRVVLGKDVKFHPDEISRVRSKRWVTHLFNRAGFRVIEYSFGPRDVWTYSIIVAERGE
jgi:ubiquinone/menaquinone biosynthesis C-methylase UbiE